MALLTAQAVDPAGAVVTFGAAAGGGDTFRPTSDRCFLWVNNGAGAPIDVTLTTNRSVVGLTVPNRVKSVPAGALMRIPLLKSLYANPTTGLISIGYSSPTSVTVAVTEG